MYWPVNSCSPSQSQVLSDITCKQTHLQNHVCFVQDNIPCAQHTQAYTAGSQRIQYCALRDGKEAKSSWTPSMCKVPQEVIFTYTSPLCISHSHCSLIRKKREMNLIDIGLAKKFIWVFCEMIWKKLNEIFGQPNMLCNQGKK